MIVVALLLIVGVLKSLDDDFLSKYYLNTPTFQKDQPLNFSNRILIFKRSATYLSIMTFLSFRDQFFEG